MAKDTIELLRRTEADAEASEKSAREKAAEILDDNTARCDKERKKILENAKKEAEKMISDAESKAASDSASASEKCDRDLESLAAAADKKREAAVKMIISEICR